jgi:4-aminobutyrate aminotransferase-like enzyme
MESVNHSLNAIAHYGVDFIPDIIVSAQGSELITSDGTKILDWTSGQVSTDLGQLSLFQRTEMSGYV